MLSIDASGLIPRARGVEELACLKRPVHKT